MGHWLVSMTAVRIALVYGLAASVWILVSDNLLASFIGDVSRLTRAQTYKGWIFIALTALLLYVLLRQEFRIRDGAIRTAQKNANENAALAQHYASAQAETEAARHEIAALLESITDAFVALDTNWCYRYVNAKAGELLGREPAALLGKNIWTEFPDGLNERFAREYKRAAQTQQATRFEAHYPPWDRWFENRVFPRPDGLTIFFHDITERKRNERALRESQELFQATFEQAAVGIAHVGLEGEWLRVNRRFCEIVGYSAEELLAQYFHRITHPDDLPNDIAGVRQLFRREIGAYTGERRYLRRDGTEVWVNLTVSLVRDAGGKPQYFIAVIEDIGERKRAEFELRHSESRFRSLTLATTQIVWVTNAAGDVENDMPSWRAFTGQSVQEIQGYGWLAAVHPDDRARIARTWQHSLATITRYETEYRVRRHDGRYFDFAVRGVPVRGERGELLEWIGACSDISERKRAEHAIRQLNATLEQRVAQRTQQVNESNAALQAFAYSVSHDLRAPLRAMQGFAQALVEDFGSEMPAGGREYAGRIVGAAKRMDHIIEDLLTFSRLSGADLPLRAVTLEDALDIALQQIGDEIARTHARVEVRSPLGRVHGHRTTLVQVFVNLIGNAIKFVAPGTVPHVAVTAQRHDDEIEIGIADNGIGIDAAHRERVFGLFERLHGIETYPGTGIGLAIVRKGCRAHGWPRRRRHGCDRRQPLLAAVAHRRRQARRFRRAGARRRRARGRNRPRPRRGRRRFLRPKDEPHGPHFACRR